MPTIDLRPPPTSFVLLGLSYVFLVGFLVTVFSSHPDPLTAVLFTVVAVGIAVSNASRGLSRVRTTPEGALVVRNWFRTRTVLRSDIDRVMAGRAGGPGTLHRVQLLLDDGSLLPLVATEAVLWPGKARVEAQAEQLRAWAAGR